jgi:CubicO group peptidase (beta-lactamase class C family)
MKPLIAAALLFACAGVQASPSVVPSHEQIDSTVRQVIERYQLPGIAVGVIADGEVIFSQGYGETIHGSGDPVTSRTLFKIASNSKAMTAAVLARLVQQGKLQWDDPVAQHLPEFAMYDPWVSAHMTINDLLVHNSGLPEGGGDLMFWPEPNLFTRDDIVQGLRHIKPAYGFRAGYAYDNVLYVVAGRVAEAVAGASFEALVRRELFEPLQMTGCKVGEFALADAGSVAQPHVLENGVIKRTRGDAEVVEAIASAPAGGIRCDLDAMLVWANNWLSPNAAQQAWLGQAQREEMWKARTPMPVSSLKKRWEKTHYHAYAYGFRLADSDGVWTVSHTGTLGGMYSMMMLLPDQKSGFVFMINGAGGAARTVLGTSLLKLFTAPAASLGVAGYADDLAKPAAVTQVNQTLPDLRKRKPVRAGEMQAWLGRWRDPWFGEVRICQVGQGVQWRSLKSPKMQGDISRLDGRYMLVWDSKDVDEEPWLSFSEEAGVRKLHMAKINPRGDWSSDYEHFSFTKVGECD